MGGVPHHRSRLEILSAMLYSIVSTGRANGLEAYAYLRRLFAQLPKTKNVEHFETLLPFSNLSDEAISNT
jgi:IS66 C-terminal element